MIFVICMAPLCLHYDNQPLFVIAALGFKEKGRQFFPSLGNRKILTHCFHYLACQGLHYKLSVIGLRLGDWILKGDCGGSFSLSVGEIRVKAYSPMGQYFLSFTRHATMAVTDILQAQPDQNKARFVSWHQ